MESLGLSLAVITAFVLMLGLVGLGLSGMLQAASKPTPKPAPRSKGRRTYAEGRPTMPSEVEPAIEYIRRRRSECVCSDCMEPTLRGGEKDPPSLR